MKKDECFGVSISAQMFGVCSFIFLTFFFFKAFANKLQMICSKMEKTRS